jgi:cadmium resistance protein CadD (predicted permease)
MKDKVKAIDFLATLICIVVCIWWAFNADYVEENPYILGLLRGFVWVTLGSNALKYWK